ncbi:MAG: outer membrane protein assembly factor BamD [Deltaproteobacteria bacterium]|jgi:TolA-binding protein|nr:outer membrane protein assembly factor BamD [Deltaproteobacteria bacterium]
MRDVDDEVRQIKKEIVESRGLIIKTNNLINALGADIKSIAKRQAGYERRLNWNSGVAIAVIGVLSFVGLKLYFDAQTGGLRLQKAEAEGAAEELREELSDEVRRSSDRGAAAAKAAKFYELIRERKRAEVVRQYPAMAKEALSPAEASMFRDFEQQFRQDLSREAYQKGLQLASGKKQEEAIARFEEALELHPSGSHVPAVKYALASSLRKEKRFAEALVYAQQVADQTVDAALQPDGWWLVALCARDLGDLDTAKDALKILINKWSRSALARDARPLFRDVTREIWSGKQGETAAPAAPGQ